MDTCENCNYFIDACFGDVGTCSKFNKTTIKHSTKNCFENNIISDDTKQEWTLEKAREDYMKNNKDCEMCKFSRNNTVIVNNSVKTNLHCLVKEENFINSKEAEQCKYYTVESEGK